MESKLKNKWICWRWEFQEVTVQDVNSGSEFLEVIANKLLFCWELWLLWNKIQIAKCIFNLIKFSEYCRLRQIGKLEVSIFWILAVNFWEKKRKSWWITKMKGDSDVHFTNVVYIKSKTIMENLQIYTTMIHRKTLLSFKKIYFFKLHIL